MKRSCIGGLAIATGAALVLAACGMRGSDNASTMTSYQATAAKSDTAELFTLPKDQLAHIHISLVARGRLTRMLRFTGSVAYNAFTTTPVFSAAGGPVREILVAPGDSVRVGQPLLNINSPDYSQARSAYLKARDAFQLADKNYKRAVDLFEHKAIPERDEQQAESDRAQAQADMESSADVLRALGVTDPEATVKSQATLQVPLLAPVAGEVVERLVGPGQLLQGGATQCFTISDTGTVWVLVNVYQKDLGSVQIGDAADVTTDAYPQVFRGRISYIAPALDPNTRTLQERIVTENPGHKLKKDMYVTATVRAGTVENALTVPDAAILRDTENQPFVYVQSAEGQFSRRLVALGDSFEGRTQITSGVKAGDPVVGDGSLFLQFQNSLQH